MISMHLYLLFPTVKTAALSLVSVKNYWKNTHGHLFFGQTVVQRFSFICLVKNMSVVIGMRIKLKEKSNLKSLLVLPAVLIAGS